MAGTDYKTILRLIGQKAPEGLVLLYERYGKPLCSFAIERWELSEDEALEIVYRTLETLILKLPSYSFESQASFDGFLFKVFINFLRQKYRENRRKQLPQLEFVDIEQEIGVPGEIQGALEKQSFSEYYSSEVVESSKMRSLKLALAKLDEADRDILLLRAQNYTYDEIASLLKIENNQLKVKYHRAKQKLIKLFNEAIDSI